MNRNVEKIIQQWPEAPRESALRLIDHYGPPQEYSASQLMWHETPDGWKRTVLSRDEVPHAFPAHHTDYLLQSINYKVPVDMFSKLAQYDGSVIADRTKGEMAARCGGTSMNFVAINLAHDIVERRRTVAEARAEYQRLYDAFQAGEKPEYTQRFQFEVAKQGTGDPDHAL